MHKIFAVALNLHDHNTYDVMSFIIKEKDLLDLNTIYPIMLKNMIINQIY